MTDHIAKNHQAIGSPLRGRAIDRANFGVDVLFLSLFFYFQAFAWVEMSFGVTLFLDSAQLGGSSPLPSWRSIYRLTTNYYIPALILLIFLIVAFSPRPNRGRRVSLSTILPVAEGSGSVLIVTKPGSPISERSSIYQPTVVVPQDDKRPARNRYDEPRLAHELAHARFRDYLILKLYILAVTLSPIYVLFTIFDTYGLSSEFLAEENRFRIEEMARFAGALTAPAIALFRLRAFLHTREYRADFIASQTVGIDKYVKYMEFCKKKERLSKWRGAVASFFDRIFHPSFSARLNRVKDTESSSFNVSGIAFFFGFLAFSFSAQINHKISSLYYRPLLCISDNSIIPSDGFACASMVAFVPFLILWSFLLVNLTRPISGLKLSEKIKFWSISLSIPVLMNATISVLSASSDIGGYLQDIQAYWPLYTTMFFLLKFVSLNWVFFYPTMLIAFYNRAFEIKESRMTISSTVSILGGAIFINNFVARDMELFYFREAPQVVDLYSSVDPPLSHWFIMNWGIFFIGAIALDLLRNRFWRKEWSV
jgi:hypothetical protein